MEAQDNGKLTPLLWAAVNGNEGAMSGLGTPHTVIWLWVKTLVPLVNIKIAAKWMFIPLKMVLIGIDPYPYEFI